MRLNRLFRVFVAIGAFAMVSSGACATLVNGKHQDVGISSYPTGATILVDNQPVGSTPTVVPLSRKDNHTIRIELKGFEPHEIVLTKSVSGWMAGNAVLCVAGVVGIAVDALTGSMWKLTPDHVAATFGNVPQHAASARDTLFIAVVFKPEAGWERIGALRELTATVQ